MDSKIPLAERLRPKQLDELIGQDHLAGKDSILRKAIESGNIPSMILWGPPGTGKTTIANIIANQVKIPFKTLSAVSAGVKDVRMVIDQARKTGSTVLFIDEIHRFNKSQQDALLHAVEKGIITLIGATTENPSFEVNSALLSRCQVYILKKLDQDGLVELLNTAIEEDFDLKKRTIDVRETEAIINLSGGDARKLLNLLELIVDATPDDLVIIEDRNVMEIAQQRVALYDKSGEQHYDIISAFIKSVRGSDPNAALYYLARMIAGGEDVKFIARRLLILASEDIGNANPNALVLANSCFQAVNIIGYPEADLILSQTTIYLATSPKSNSALNAIKGAKKLVEATGDLPVPLAIRNAPTQLMKKEGYGKDYQYAHSFEGNFIEMEFMPEELIGKVLYEPGRNPKESEIRKRLQSWWKNKYGY